MRVAVFEVLDDGERLAEVNIWFDLKHRHRSGRISLDMRGRAMFSPLQVNLDEVARYWNPE
jgi:hypothetical protein